MKAVPSTALKVIKSFVAEYLPELNEHGIPLVKSRVCWYNDSYDNHLVVDHVPGKEGLMVATGGSGHAFKYLPVLGRYIVDIVEGKSERAVGDQKEIFERWKWRDAKARDKVVNVLGEGSGGMRTLSKQILVTDEELNANEKTAWERKARL